MLLFHCLSEGHTHNSILFQCRFNYGIADDGKLTNESFQFPTYQWNSQLIPSEENISMSEKYGKNTQNFLPASLWRTGKKFHGYSRIFAIFPRHRNIFFSARFIIFINTSFIVSQITYVTNKSFSIQYVTRRRLYNNAPSTEKSEKQRISIY